MIKTRKGAVNLATLAQFCPSSFIIAGAVNAGCIFFTWLHLLYVFDKVYVGLGEVILGGGLQNQFVTYNPLILFHILRLQTEHRVLQASWELLETGPSPVKLVSVSLTKRRRKSSDAI